MLCNFQSFVVPNVNADVPTNVLSIRQLKKIFPGRTGAGGHPGYRRERVPGELPDGVHPHAPDTGLHVHHHDRQRAWHRRGQGMV